MGTTHIWPWGAHGMASESLLGWMYPGPGSLPPKDSPTQPPHPRASQNPGHHAPLQDAWAATPMHTTGICKLHSHIPVALDTHHTQQGHPCQQEWSQGPPGHDEGSSSSPGQAQTLQNCDVSLKGCGQEPESTSAEALGRGAPRRTRSSGTAAWSPQEPNPGRSPTLTQKQVKSHKRHLQEA